MINVDDAIATLTINEDSPTTLTVGTDYDPVKKPEHYGKGAIECIDYIKDFLDDEELTGYFRGNVAKYLHRWRYKNGIEDLKQASWYLNALIDHESKKEGA